MLWLGFEEVYMSRVVHFEIPADDPKRAIKFYEKVFEALREE